MNNEEDIIQAACYWWFWNTHRIYRKLLFAVPNGGKRSKITAMLMKSTGVTPGIPDLIFVVYGKCYAFEVKVPGGTLTGDQPLVHQIWDTYGNPIWIIYSLEQFQEIITGIIYNLLN